MKKTSENNKMLIKTRMIFRFKKRSRVFQCSGTTIDPTETTTTLTGTSGIN